MKCDCFLFWTSVFKKHLNTYKIKHPSQIRNSRVVLFLDSRSSRGCPIALWLLNWVSVEVIIEPANTCHVVQMFDAYLASLIKNHFRKIYHNLEKNDKTEFPNIISRLLNTLYLKNIICFFILINYITLYIFFLTIYFFPG